MYSDTWQDHKVHGFFGDGTYSDDGSTYGAWLVMNTVRYNESDSSGVEKTHDVNID